MLLLGAQKSPLTPRVLKLTMAGPVWSHHAELNCIPFPLDKQPLLQWKKIKATQRNICNDSVASDTVPAPACLSVPSERKLLQSSVFPQLRLLSNIAKRFFQVKRGKNPIPQSILLVLKKKGPVIPWKPRHSSCTQAQGSPPPQHFQTDHLG